LGESDSQVARITSLWSFVSLRLNFSECNVLKNGVVSKVKFMRYIVTFLVIMAVTVSCSKNHAKGGEKVEIYHLQTLALVPGKCQVDGSKSAIESTAFITNDDILEYSQGEHEFKLTDNGIQKIKAMGDRTSFALTVDGKVVYYGFFKPSFSSSSCDHSITMDLSLSSGDKILMRLGYPGLVQGMQVEDKRNDPMLMATLDDQGKLRL
jgi:hypothetical protein